MEQLRLLGEVPGRRSERHMTLSSQPRHLCVRECFWALGFRVHGFSLVADVAIGFVGIFVYWFCRRLVGLYMVFLVIHSYTASFGKSRT